MKMMLVVMMMTTMMMLVVMVAVIGRTISQMKSKVASCHLCHPSFLQTLPWRLLSGLNFAVRLSTIQHVWPRSDTECYGATIANCYRLLLAAMECHRVSSRAEVLWWVSTINIGQLRPGVKPSKARMLLFSEVGWLRFQLRFGALCQLLFCELFSLCSGIQILAFVKSRPYLTHMQSISRFENEL